MKTVFKITVCIVLLVSMLAFAACNNGGKDNASQSVDSGDNGSAEQSAGDTAHIVGTWYAPGYTIMFKADGTGVYGKTDALFPITWEIADGKLTVKYDNDTVHENEEYTVAEDGTTLTVGDTIYSNEPVEIAKNTDVELIGTWYNYSSAGEEITVFNADGTGTMAVMGLEVSMTWAVVDGVLSLNVNMGDAVGTEMKVDSYAVDGDTLTLTMMGQEGVYTKERRELGGLFGDDVDTEHELGGDSALVGEWIFGTGEDEGIVTITADGKFIMDDEDMEMECLWYTEDGYLMAYNDFFGVATAILSGEYTVDGDIISIVHDGGYTEMARKDSGKTGCDIMVMGIDKEDVSENDVGFSEGDSTECVKFYVEGAVKDLKFIRYVYEGRDVGDFVNCIELHAIKELAEDGSFVVDSTFKFDMLSDGYEDAQGISFTNSNGDTVYLVVIYNEDTETYGFYKVNDPIWIQ